MPNQLRAAVIGAGVSGLTCAFYLQKSGWQVDVFEKSRGAGGRLAVKRLESIGNVDLGAQFITARTPDFAQFFSQAEALGNVAIWPARIAYLGEEAAAPAKAETRWIGTPGMNAWLNLLWSRDKIHVNQRIERLTRSPNGSWHLDPAGHSDGYQCVILAMPPAQAAMLAPQAPFAERLGAIRMQPCWAALALFERELAVDFDAAFVRRGGLDWIAANHTKPGRTSHPAAWTLHAGPELSQELLENSPEQVGPKLLDALNFALNAYPKLPAAQLAVVHRWRYASPTGDQPPGIFWAADWGLAACGDWSVGGRVEGAFTAGRDLAGAIVNSV